MRTQSVTHDKSPPHAAFAWVSTLMVHSLAAARPEASSLSDSRWPTWTVQDVDAKSVRLAGLEREIGNLVKAIAECGMPTHLKSRLIDAEQEHAELRRSTPV